MAKVRQQVGGYVWRKKTSALLLMMAEQRRLLDEISTAVQRYPISPVVVLACALQMAQTITSAIQLIHALEQIAESNKEESQ